MENLLITWLREFGDILNQITCVDFWFSFRLRERKRFVMKHYEFDFKSLCAVVGTISYYVWLFWFFFSSFFQQQFSWIIPYIHKGRSCHNLLKLLTSICDITFGEFSLKLQKLTRNNSKKNPGNSTQRKCKLKTDFTQKKSFCTWNHKTSRVIAFYYSSIHLLLTEKKNY